MTEWISVKDRLPDGDGNYAICYRDGNGRWNAGIARFCYSNASGEFKDAEPSPVFFAFDESNHVHHYEKAEFWLALPKAPKEGETKK